MPARLGLLLLAALALAVCAEAPAQETPMQIQPIPVPGNDSFPDPFPILDPANPANRNKIGNDFWFFSTQDKAMHFPSFAFARPATVQPIAVDLSWVRQRLHPAFDIAGSLWAKSVFYDRTTCAWHMIASVRLGERRWRERFAQGRAIWPEPFQTVIVHASPDNTACADPAAAWSRISAWTVDRELIGHIPAANDPPAAIGYAYANYAGKLVQDAPGGPLYLVYVKRLDAQRTAIAAQPMAGPAAVDSSKAPIILLASEPRLLSEYRDAPGGLQIIETGNVVKLGRTWALLYTTGNYQRNNYKIGIAYSDALTGPYQKVYADDARNVWGGGGEEVVYLVQTQNPGWFNFTRQVVAPGVPSILADASGGRSRYYLTFAGYPPDTSYNPRGEYDPAQRIGYFAPLDVSIPDSPTAVAASQKYGRAEWVKIRRQ
jgi:hypothetical protein